MNIARPLKGFGWDRPACWRSLALASVVAIAGCSNSGHRSTESAAPTSPTAVASSSETGTNRPTLINRSSPRLGGGSFGAQDVAFPPRNEPFDFRLRLETQYQSVLRRGATSSFVDIEGTIVWTQEYLRYRVNGCGHADAVSRVTAQILGQAIQPVCSNFTGTSVNFPPRNEPFDFRQELERLYRDVLRRGAVQTFVDTEGDIVWTQEYLRYRVNNCSHTEAVDRVLAQTLGGAVQPTCGPGGGGGGGGTATGGGGTITGFVSAVSSGATQGVQQSSPRPNAGAGPIVGVANAGQFSAGGTTQVTLTATSPISTVYVSANSTGPSGSSFRPSAVTDTYYLLNLPSPQTTIPLSIQLSQNVSGFFALEFGGSAAGGPVGNFAQLGVQINSQPTCTYALLNGTSSFGAGGGPGNVSVSVQPGCGWQLTTNVPWLSLSPTAGTGSTGVNYSVAANTGATRTGRITLSGTSGGSAFFDVTQAGNACSYTVAANNTSFAAAGGSFNVTITTNAGCGWSASSLSGFLTPSGNTSGTGTGNVTFTVGANTTNAARSGSVRVAFTSTGGSQDIAISQAGQTVPPPVAVILNPSSCVVNSACNFDGSRSQGQITDWSWDFGDGTTGSGPMVNHPYATNFVSSFSSRAISVRLTVNGPGGSNSATSTITISRSY